MSGRRVYVGIFAVPRRTSSPSRYGEQGSFFAKLTRVGAARNVTVYTFSPRDIDWGSRRVWGRVYSPRLGGWVRRPYPLPQAVYNRYPAAAYTPLVVNTIWRLKRHGTLFVNAPYVDKYRLHRRLWRWTALRPHLPESLPCQGSAAPALHLLRHYPTVYLKPVNGSLGNGVVRARRVAPGRYHVAGKIHGHRFSWAVSSAGLPGALRRVVRTQRYMAQRGLNLGIVTGRTADIRALVQRDGQGVWQVTGMAFRVGPGGSVTSNLHGGGHAVPVMTVLNRRFGNARAQEIMADVRRVLALFVNALERTLGPMGELGMDLGVDVHGHVWYIESNPKPGRAILRQIRAPRQRALSISRPVDYAIFLARYGHSRTLPPASFAPGLLEDPLGAPTDELAPAREPGSDEPPEETEHEEANQEAVL